MNGGNEAPFTISHHIQTFIFLNFQSRFIHINFYFNVNFTHVTNFVLIKHTHI